MKTEITILWGNDKVKKTYVFEDETKKQLNETIAPS